MIAFTVSGSLAIGDSSSAVTDEDRPWAQRALRCFAPVGRTVQRRHRHAAQPQGTHGWAAGSERPLDHVVSVSLPASRCQGRLPSVSPLQPTSAAERASGRPRELKAELVARLCRDATLVLDLRGATFLGAGAARLLLDLRSQAAAAGVRLVLWRPEGQPFRTLRIVRFDRVFELRPASWRPPRSRDWTVAQPERWVDVRAGSAERARPSPCTSACCSAVDPPRVPSRSPTTRDRHENAHDGHWSATGDTLPSHASAW